MHIISNRGPVTTQNRWQRKLNKKYVFLSFTLIKIKRKHSFNQSSPIWNDHVFNTTTYWSMKIHLIK